MSFTINPDLSGIFDSLNLIQFSGISFLWGGILALIVTLMISTEKDHIKVTLLPTTIALHTMGIYQHFLVVIISAFMFVTSSMTMQMLKGGLQAISATTKTLSDSFKDATKGSLALGAIKYGGISRALEVRKLQDKIANAKSEIFLNKFKDKDLIAHTSNKGDIALVQKFNPLTQQDEIQRVNLLKKNEGFMQGLDKLAKITDEKKNIAREIGKNMSSSGKSAKKRSNLVNVDVIKSAINAVTRDITNYGETEERLDLLGSLLQQLQKAEARK